MAQHTGVEARLLTRGQCDVGVEAWRRLISAVVVALWFLIGSPPMSVRAEPSAFPQYKIGELAAEDVAAPMPMAVIDPVRTEVLRKDAAARIAAVLRRWPDYGAEAEQACLDDFAKMRGVFTEAVKQASQKPQLDEATLRHPSFRRFLHWFQARYPAFPLSAELANTWALGGSGNETAEVWAGHVRQVMARCIHARPLPAEFLGTVPYVKVVEWDEGDEALSMESIDGKGSVVRLDRLLSLPDARAQIASMITLDDAPLGTYLGGFLRVNTEPEEVWTRLRREQATFDMLAVDRYEEGQWIVRRGQRVDSRVEAALTFLVQTEKAVQEPAMVRQAVARQAEQVPGAGSLWERLQSNPQWSGWWTRPKGWPWMVAVVFLAVWWGFLRWARKRRAGSSGKGAGHEASQASQGAAASYTVVLGSQGQQTVFHQTSWAEGMGSGTDLNGQSPPMSVQSSGEGLAPEEVWQQRALEAERRAEEILRQVREGLAPHLARRMMSRLVQELLAQRADWMSVSQEANQDLAAMECRLARTQAQWQERLQALAKRTEDLEKALAAKTEETEGLIRSQMAMTRSSIEAKKTVSREDFLGDSHCPNLPG